MCVCLCMSVFVIYVYNIKHSFSCIIQLCLNIHYQSFLIMEKETERESKEMAKKVWIKKKLTYIFKVRNNLKRV